MCNPLFLFFYHKQDSITESCYRQLCQIEGLENVIPVSNNLSILPNTFYLPDYPSLFPQYSDYWMYDGLIYKYVLHNKESLLSKDVIITLEYDTWWNYKSDKWIPQLIQEYDVIAGEQVYYTKEPSWSFFTREPVNKLNIPKHELFALRPLAVTISKPSYLIKMSELVRDNELYHHVENCELRYGITAKQIGAKIIDSPFKNTVKWHEWNMPHKVKDLEGIYHPIKHIDKIT
jgi:hypothetical protein